MKRYLWVVMFLPLILVLITSTIYVKSILVIRSDIEDFYAEKVANYCSDAATLELINSSDLDMDSADLSSLSLDPELAVNEYGVVLALTLGMQPTEETVKDVLTNYVKILTVCCNDGYYVYEALRPSSDEPYELIGTPKLPYTYVAGEDDYYALTLNNNKCWRFYLIDDENPYLYSKVDSPLANKVTCNAYINQRLSEDLNYRIQKLYDNGWDNNIYIPASVSSISRVNPIQGPTVFALTDGFCSTQAFGIGGTKLTMNRVVVGYTRQVSGSPVKYYAYSDLLDDTMASSIVEVFSSIGEAAAAGYAYDFEVMK